MSRALQKRPKAEIQLLKEKFGTKYPSNVTSTDSKWVLEGDILKLKDVASDAPVSIVTAPELITGFFSVTEGKPKDDRPASLQLKLLYQSSSTEVKELDDAWQFLLKTFGARGSLAQATETHFNAMTGKFKPAGVNAKNLAAKIDADLTAEAGIRPLFMPQKIKQRTVGEDQSEKKVFEFSFKLYLSQKATVTREPGTLPDSIADAFVDVPDHPVAVFFRENPNTVPSDNVYIFTAEGKETPWKILASASNKGTSQYYVKFLASARLGGISMKYLGKDRKLFTCSMFVNRPGGVKVFGVPMGSGGGEEPIGEESDVYSLLTGKRTQDEDKEDVYDETAQSPKRVKTDE